MNISLVDRGEASLVLPAKRLDVGFAVRIEQILAALLPRHFEFGRCDVPGRPALSDYGAEVLAELLQSGPAEEPVAVVDLVDDKTGLEDNHVGDHGIVARGGVLGDVEILMDNATRIGEEGPGWTESRAI